MPGGDSLSTRMNLRQFAGRGLALGAAAAVAGVFFLDVCHLIYDCGCVSLWSGGAAFCNIQTAGPPDCPFCAQPNVAYGALYGTFLVQAAVVFAPTSRSLRFRALVALLAFPVVVGAVGLGLGLEAGYWQ